MVIMPLNFLICAKMEIIIVIYILMQTIKNLPRGCSLTSILFTLNNKKFNSFHI